MDIAIAQFASGLDIYRFPLSQVGIQFMQVGDDPDILLDLKMLNEELKNSHDIRVSSWHIVPRRSLMSSDIGYGWYSAISWEFNERNYYKDLVAQY